MINLRTIYFMLGVVLAIFCSVEIISCLSLEKINSLQDPIIVPELENVVVTQNIDEIGQKIFNLKAFGEDLKLIVNKNYELATPHTDVIKRHDGRTVSWERIADTYYTGFVDSKPGSCLTVKIKDGYLSGVIITDSHFITIAGLSDDFAAIAGLQHIITRRKHEKNDSKLFNTTYHQTSHIQNTKRNKRALDNNRYVEVMMVADKYTTEFFGNFTEQYLMSVAYLTNAVFQSNSIGNIKAMYVVVKIILISGYEEALDVFKHDITGSIAYLHLFAGWAKQFYKPDDNNPEHFDQGLLLSRRLCGKVESCAVNGRAYLGGMCSSTSSMASSNAYGLSAGLAVAHETGHNLGLGHDSGDCQKSYIMNSALGSGANAFKWSPCSRNKLQTWFNDKNVFKCLYDVPSNIFSSNDIVNLAKNYSGDDQCRMTYGPGNVHCGPLKSNCVRLYCLKVGSTTCRHHGSPPLEGTTCGTYKWCKGGACVDRPIPPPVDGNWGAWSTFSQCSRSCGMGVRYRTRSCDNPTPAFFGKSCSGDNKGHFETCNTQDCSGTSQTFRWEQCQEKSTLKTDYFDASSPCLLRCKQGSSISYYGTVKDGTLCSKFKDVYDVCVLGECKEVGCDRALLSQKYFDRCRVCDGDGSTCKLIQNTYTTVHTKKGKNNAAVMFTLPVGATNVLVKEPQSNFNGIGVKDENDTWIIVESYSTIKYFAGSRITYYREKSKDLEILTINGPTTEPLKIMFIFNFERNPGTSYQYYVLLTTPDTSPVTFYWNSTMSECNQTCGRGAKDVIPKCYRTDDNTEVGLKHCDAATKPSGSVPCNTQACEPRWEIGTWSACSDLCGPSGKRTRTVECRQKITNANDQILDDSKCKDPKLKTEEKCNLKDCEPNWEVGEWSACSRKTCEGRQTRQLYCKKVLVSSVKEDILDFIKCPPEKPITEVICNSGVTCYKWRTVYPSCTECEDASLSNSISYKAIGCYNLENNLYGPVLEDFRETFKTHKTKTVSDCASKSWKRARRLFAVGNNGMCYSSMDAHENYFKDGKSSNCVDKIGGKGAVFVYAINGLALVSNQTCFQIENDSVVEDSFCDDGNPKPDPEIKICCEDVCESHCFKTEDGGHCVIPFIYKGKMYHGCTKNDEGKLWCATTSNYDIDQQGAECKEPCRQKTTSGQCCSFPFIYRGRLHNTCIQSGSEPGWCALTSNYDRDYMKDTCV